MDELVFKTKKDEQRIDIRKCLTNNKEKWVIDLKSPESNKNIDYMLILWNLRRFSIVDNYFFDDSYQDKSTQERKRKLVNDTTLNNNTHLPSNNDSISKIKSLRVELLGYKNLKIDNEPATLIFYLNG